MSACSFCERPMPPRGGAVGFATSTRICRRCTLFLVDTACHRHSHELWTGVREETREKLRSIVDLERIQDSRSVELACNDLTASASRLEYVLAALIAIGAKVGVKTIRTEVVELCRIIKSLRGVVRDTAEHDTLVDLEPPEAVNA